jgi:hypothetical protein
MRGIVYYGRLVDESAQERGDLHIRAMLSIYCDIWKSKVIGLHTCVVRLS